MEANKVALGERIVRHFRAWVSYDGTDFCGFQEQPGQKTVQSALKDALAKISKGEFRMKVAGRTDAGVHAKDQAVSIEMATSLSLEQLVYAISHSLPKSIRVHRVDEMPAEFDSKRHAVGKRYIYRIWNALVSEPFSERYRWHIRRNIDIEAMRQAANFLVGEHDFESFRSSNCQASHARRKIWLIEITRNGHLIELDIRGNAFCQNMVRIITGTLVEVGTKKRLPSDVKDILNAKDRCKAGITAPAKGLTLDRVYYPDDLSSALIPQNAIFPRFPVTKQTWPFEKNEIQIGPVNSR